MKNVLAKIKPSPYRNVYSQVSAETFNNKFPCYYHTSIIFDMNILLVQYCKSSSYEKCCTRIKAVSVQTFLFYTETFSKCKTAKTSS